MIPDAVIALIVILGVGVCGVISFVLYTNCCRSDPSRIKYASVS